MSFQFPERFDISDEVLSQEVNGETVLLDLQGDSYFSLNKVGTRIWQLLQNNYAVGEVLEILEGEYDVDRGALEQDLQQLLGELLQAGLVTTQSLREAP
jgi:hypothetical protein